MARHVEIAKYIFLGGLNFLLTFTVFNFLLNNFAIHYNLALFASWFVGMVFMYTTNFVWVFRGQGSFRFDIRFFRFLLVGIVSISCNMLALSLVVTVWNTDPFWTQMLLLPAIVAFNFLATKHFSLALYDRVEYDKTRSK